MPRLVDPQQTTCIRRSRTRQPLSELGLVLAAVSIDHDIEFDGHEWCLRVRSGDAVAAEAELADYQHENRPAPRVYRPAETVDSGWVGVFGYLLAIWALPSLEVDRVFGWDWREAGVMDSSRVMAGAWWRTVTSLTLHADLAHLVGNSVFGAVFGLFVGRYLGSGLGWLLVLVAGAAGNGIDAFFRDPGFRAVGASTATFASLSLVGTYVWRRRFMRGWDWRRRFAPVFAGVALLAYTGFGAGNIDVVAHVAGFGAGLVLGLAVGGIDVRGLGRGVQVWCGAAAMTLLAWAWYRAGMAPPG